LNVYISMKFSIQTSDYYLILALEGIVFALVHYIAIRLDNSSCETGFIYTMKNYVLPYILLYMLMVEVARMFSIKRESVQLVFITKYIYTFSSACASQIVINR
jgi:hypothetical protein